MRPRGGRRRPRGEPAIVEAAADDGGDIGVHPVLFGQHGRGDSARRCQALHQRDIVAVGRRRLPL
eukprot:scaffold648274_cov48-Prasinocladus_malaysianus.AAC.1